MDKKFEKTKRPEERKISDKEKSLEKKLEERKLAEQRSKKLEQKEREKRGKNLLKRVESIPKDGKNTQKDISKEEKKPSEKYTFYDHAIQEAFEDASFGSEDEKLDAIRRINHEPTFREILKMGGQYISDMFRWEFSQKNKMIKYDYERDIVKNLNPYDDLFLGRLLDLDKGRRIMEQNTIGKKVLEKIPLDIYDFDKLDSFDKKLRAEVNKRYADQALHEARNQLARLAVDDVLEPYRKKEIELSDVHKIMDAIRAIMTGKGDEIVQAVFAQINQEDRILNTVGQSYRKWFEENKDDIQKKLVESDPLYTDDTAAFWGGMSLWDDNPALGEALLAQYEKGQNSSVFQKEVDRMVDYVGKAYDEKESRKNEWDVLLLKSYQDSLFRGYFNPALKLLVYEEASRKLAKMPVSRFRTRLATKIAPKTNLDKFYFTRKVLAAVINPFRGYKKSRPTGTVYTDEERYYGRSEASLAAEQEDSNRHLQRVIGGWMAM